MAFITIVGWDDNDEVQTPLSRFAREEDAACQIRKQSNNNKGIKVQVTFWETHSVD